MSAAALIGATTLLFSDVPLTISAALRAMAMLVICVVLLLSGTLLNAEE